MYTSIRDSQPCSGQFPSHPDQALLDPLLGVLVHDQAGVVFLEEAVQAAEAEPGISIFCAISEFEVG